MNGRNGRVVNGAFLENRKRRRKIANRINLFKFVIRFRFYFIFFFRRTTNRIGSLYFGRPVQLLTLHVALAAYGRERTTKQLLSVKQGENESLRDFIGRFNVEAVSIVRLLQDVTALALMTGLKEGSPFRSYLGRKSYTSLELVLGKDNDFIGGEGRI